MKSSFLLYSNITDFGYIVFFSPKRDMMATSERLNALGLGGHCSGSKVVVANVMQCSLCQGTVNKLEHVFKCEDCGAMGDFITGIMTNMERLKPSK